MIIESAFTEKLLFEKNDKIVTYTGRNQFGTDYFCYIRCGLQGYKKMQENYLNKTVTMPELYGEVIYTDFIPTPDEKAETFLKNWLKSND